MRWIKHLTTTCNDEKIDMLFSVAGYAGYGLWWRVLEIIAENIDAESEKCSIRYTIGGWASKLRLSPHVVCNKLATLHDVGLLKMTRDDHGVEMTCPNLLKYRDEYTSRIGIKSGHYRDRGTPETEAEANTEAKAKREPFPLPAWIPLEAWSGFEQMRIRVRSPLTQRARQLTIKKLEKLKEQGQDPVACLDESTQRGWRGVFPIKQNGNGKGLELFNPSQTPLRQIGEDND